MKIELLVPVSRSTQTNTYYLSHSLLHGFLEREAPTSLYKANKKKPKREQNLMGAALG
jgi:hypothetical protein